MDRKIAYLGLFSGAAILLGYVESLIPIFAAVPGMKLGLANLAILLVLYQYGLREAVAVQVVRILVIGFLFGNLFSIVFSMAGGMLSLLVMWILKRTGGFSLIGVSVAGGLAHNIGQICMAALVVENFQIFYYLPILMVSGVITGVLIGILSGEIRKRI
ncbi:MAG TPA: Gx transporter family protein [Candidatus Pelethocola excrementipullorum]|nr:Gx transporter family protein [Candidatus Pelethocola excrementipullorum]